VTPSAAGQDCHWPAQPVLDTGCPVQRARILGGLMGEAAEDIAGEQPGDLLDRLRTVRLVPGPGVPVTHQTRRQGRPCTLVLAKTEALYAREQEARIRDQTDLEWLATQRNPDAPAVPSVAGRQARNGLRTWMPS